MLTEKGSLNNASMHHDLAHGSRTEAEAYMCIASERYRLIRSHEWNDQVIERLRAQSR